MNRMQVMKDEMGNYVEREFHYAPMWYHTRGLMQTATGYGSRLNTGYKVLYAGKLRRVYAVCYSNNASLYVNAFGSRRFLGI